MIGREPLHRGCRNLLSAKQVTQPELRSNICYSVSSNFQSFGMRCICFSDNKSMFSKFKMAASAILNLGKYALLMKRLRSMSDSQHSHQIWWGSVQKNDMATDFRNSRWRRPPSWNFINMHFRCNSWVQCQIFNIPTKFGDDWSNSNEM